MTQNKSITEYMSGEAVSANIRKTLGDKTTQFIASVVATVNSNEALKRCDHSSVLSACLIAATLDLPINQNLGFAYVIPYKDRAQFQMGYKGFIQLAQRSGQFETINVTDVKEGEIVSHDNLTGEYTFQWADRDARGGLETIGYAAHIKLLNGFRKTLYMTVDELRAHASKYSASYKRNSSTMNLWRDDFDAMARKTVLKLLLSRYAPLTTEMSTAEEADQAVIDGDGFKYVDNVPIDPADLASEKENERVRKHIEGAKDIDELRQVSEFLTDETSQLYEAKEAELVGDFST